MSSLYVTLLLINTVAITQAVTGYIEYYPGNMSLILTAPHGGLESPSDIPDRDYGCYSKGNCVWSHDCGTKDRTRCKATTITDGHTLKLTQALYRELCERFGRCPHMVINKLRRRKMDANRDRDQASFNVDKAAEAWDEYHGYIQQARSAIQTMGPGMLFDIHGHAKPQEWAMLGYLIYSQRLEDGKFSYRDTSIKSLIRRRGVSSFNKVLRGSDSFGDFLSEEGFPSVPSSTYPTPLGYSYFSGGYTTRMYGSRDGGTVDAIQIESPRTFRYGRYDHYIKALACAIERFFVRNYMGSDKR